VLTLGCTTHEHQAVSWWLLHTWNKSGSAHSPHSTEVKIFPPEDKIEGFVGIKGIADEEFYLLGYNTV
jgi:hypothetical protein